MSNPTRAVVIASRGSALALAQSNMVLAQCRVAFPNRTFDLKIIKTTGDKLQAFAPTGVVPEGGKGLFTKELEVALLNGEADLAVHSLKDLPTELPPGLTLAAVTKRADVRDVLIFRDIASILRIGRGMAMGSTVKDLPQSAVVATSSTRRQAQLLAMRPDLNTVPIRGNVGTRLSKLASNAELDALVLAAAGFQRLGFRIGESGKISGEGVPDGLLGEPLSPEEMMPCVGQAALGIEARANDEVVAEVCKFLDDPATHNCVLAERAFLAAMGGGCLSPVGAYGEILEGRLRLRAVSFQRNQRRAGEVGGLATEAVELGRTLAEQLR